MNDESVGPTLLDRLIDLVLIELGESRDQSFAANSERERRLLGAVSERVERALEVSPDLVDDFWRESLPDLRRMRASRDSEAAAIGFHYGHALDLFELQIAFGMDVLNEVLGHLGGSQASALAMAAVQGADASFDVYSLVATGRTRGAYVRWRTCHEAAVTCTLLMKFGPAACDRYVAQAEVDSFKDIEQYQTAQPRLNLERFSELELAEARDRHDSALAKYPALKRRSYGWLEEFLPGANFRKAEEAARLEHLRPYYVLASHHGHAGPKGGVLMETEHRKFVVGPTTSGIAETLSLASGSMNVLFSQLVLPGRHGFEETSEPVQFASVVAVRVLAELYERICNAVEAGWAGEQAASGQG